MRRLIIILLLLMLVSCSSESNGKDTVILSKRTKPLVRWTQVIFHPVVVGGDTIVNRVPVVHIDDEDFIFVVEGSGSGDTLYIDSSTYRSFEVGDSLNFSDIEYEVVDTLLLGDVL